MIEIGFEKALFVASHGIFEEEKILKNTFQVDMSCLLRNTEFVGNDLSKSISYAALYDIVEQQMKIPMPLLEGVAENIINATKIQFPNQIQQLSIKIKKLNPPINGNIQAAFVKYTVEL